MMKSLNGGFHIDDVRRKRFRWRGNIQTMLNLSGEDFRRRNERGAITRRRVRRRRPTRGRRRHRLTSRLRTVSWESGFAWKSARAHRDKPMEKHASTDMHSNADTRTHIDKRARPHDLNPSSDVCANSHQTFPLPISEKGIDLSSSTGVVPGNVKRANIPADGLFFFTPPTIESDNWIELF